jgi:hypothetical protein
MSKSFVLVMRNCLNKKESIVTIFFLEYFHHKKENGSECDLMSQMSIKIMYSPTVLQTYSCSTYGNT